MSYLLRWIVFILLLFLLSSCSTSKSTSPLKTPTSFDLGKTLSDQNYVAIPFRIMDTGHLQIPIWINGIEANFILDTGAGQTLMEIRKQKAYKMSAVSTEEMAAGAGGGQLELKLSRGNTLAFDKVQLSDVIINLINLDHINKAFVDLGLKSVDGIIGADILKMFNGLIDYKSSTLFLQRPRRSN